MTIVDCPHVPLVKVSRTFGGAIVIQRLLDGHQR